MLQWLASTYILSIGTEDCACSAVKVGVSLLADLVTAKVGLLVPGGVKVGVDLHTDLAAAKEGWLYAVWCKGWRLVRVVV